MPVQPGDGHFVLNQKPLARSPGMLQRNDRLAPKPHGAAMSKLTTVFALAERLADLGFDWQSIQEPYKGTDGYIEYTDDVGVECADGERLFRVRHGEKDFPIRKTLKAVARDLAKVLRSGAKQGGAKM